MFSFCAEKGESIFVPTDKALAETPLEDLTPAQLQLRTSNLQLAMIFNRLCIFTSKKLRDYQESRLDIVSYIISLLVLILFTVVAFAAINLGLYKLDPNAFDVSAAPSFFQFFHYSFSALLFSSIREISPTLPVSEAAFMVEEFVALVLGMIVASVLVFVRSDRQVRDLNLVIEKLRNESIRAESRIKEGYRLQSIEDARAEIAKLQGIFLNIFDWLSRN